MGTVGRAAGEPQFGAIAPGSGPEAQKIYGAAFGNVAQAPSRLTEGAVTSTPTIKEEWTVLGPRWTSGGKPIADNAVAGGLKRVSEKFELELEVSEAEPQTKKPKFK